MFPLKCLHGKFRPIFSYLVASHYLNVHWTLKRTGVNLGLPHCTGAMTKQRFVPGLLLRLNVQRNVRMATGCYHRCLIWGLQVQWHNKKQALCWGQTCFIAHCSSPETLSADQLKTHERATLSLCYFEG